MLSASNMSGRSCVKRPREFGFKSTALSVVLPRPHPLWRPSYVRALPRGVSSESCPWFARLQFMLMLTRLMLMLVSMLVLLLLVLLKLRLMLLLMLMFKQRIAKFFSVEAVNIGRLCFVLMKYIQGNSMEGRSDGHPCIREERNGSNSIGVENVTCMQDEWQAYLCDRVEVSRDTCLGVYMRAIQASEALSFQYHLKSGGTSGSHACLGVIKKTPDRLAVCTVVRAEVAELTSERGSEAPGNTRRSCVNEEVQETFGGLQHGEDCKKTLGAIRKAYKEPQLDDEEYDEHLMGGHAPPPESGGSS